MSAHQDTFRSPRLTAKGKANFGHIDWSVKAPKAPKKEAVPVTKSSLCFPMISGDYAPYECPVTGKTIEGRVAHKENLEKTGCRLQEKGEFEDVKKNGQKRINEQIDAAVDKCVDEVASTL